MIIIAGIFFFTRMFLPTFQSLLLTLIAAGSIYIFRAGYVQPEPLYYFLAYVTFVFMAWMLVNPSLPLAVATGVIAAIAYTVKPSGLPVVFLFVIVFSAKALFEWNSGAARKEMGRKILPLLWNKLGNLAVVVVVFLGLLSPYLLENKRMFGQYFYNANTTFFIWYDLISDLKKAPGHMATTWAGQTCQKIKFPQ